MKLRPAASQTVSHTDQSLPAQGLLIAGAATRLPSQKFQTQRGIMTHSWKLQLFALILLFAALAPAGAHAQAQAQPDARTYPSFAINVPFKFTVGQRTFNAGTYQFVVLGPGLLAVLNTKTRVVVHLITRDTQQAAAPATTRLVFTIPDKGYSKLTSILLERRAQGLQIVGEEIAMRQNPRSAEPMIPLELFLPQARLPIPRQ